jgi:hypothetical protein
VSEFISLEELKKLDGGELFSMWCCARFPFDGAICSHCVTTHGHLRDCEHKEFSANSAIFFGADKHVDLRNMTDAHLEAIYSLRLFYKDLYASNPPEIESEIPVVDHFDITVKRDV